MSKKKNRSTEENKLGSLPLVIGITGHRDLRAQDLETLKSLIRDFLQELHARYPHTPLVLLSPLAEGADRLAAQVALELGDDIIVPLPMPRNEYEKSFSTSTSLAEFNDLLDKASHWFELPLCSDCTETDIQNNSELRSQQYAQVGAYIVRNSQFLIALWDGVYSNLTGGTGEIVQFSLKGIPQPYTSERNLLDSIETGPVFHISTPRTSKTNTPEEPITWNLLLPNTPQSDTEEEEGFASRFISLVRRHLKKDPQCKTQILEDLPIAYKKIYERMDNFNQDVLNLAPKQKRKNILPNEEEEKLTGSLKFILNRYAVTSNLAMSFRQEFLRAIRFVFVMGFIAVICFEIYAHLYHETPIFLFLFSIALLFANLWYFSTLFFDRESKYFDYRALAEGLRVKFFWRLAGINDSVTDRYLRRQKSEIDWIRNAIRSWSISFDVEGNSLDSIASKDLPARMQLVLKYWVENQHTYYTNASLQNNEKLSFYKMWVNIFVAISILFALFGFILAVLQVIPNPLRDGIHTFFHPGDLEKLIEMNYPAASRRGIRIKKE